MCKWQFIALYFFVWYYNNKKKSQSQDPDSFPAITSKVYFFMHPAYCEEEKKQELISHQRITPNLLI